MPHSSLPIDINPFANHHVQSDLESHIQKMPMPHFFNLNSCVPNPFPSPTMRTIAPSSVLPSPLHVIGGASPLNTRTTGNTGYAFKDMDKLSEALDETVIGGQMPGLDTFQSQHPLPPRILQSTMKMPTAFEMEMSKLSEAFDETAVGGHIPGQPPLMSYQSMDDEKNLTDEERDEALRKKRKEDAFKTALCDAYRRNGKCSYGETCRFAHGEQELRFPAQLKGKAHPKYKTQLCDKFSKSGWCPYGPKCQFIHKLKKGLPIAEYDLLIASGELSPAKEYEVDLVDQSPHKSGWQELRLDVPPPAMLKNRRSREVRSKEDQPERPAAMGLIPPLGVNSQMIESTRQKALARMLREVLHRENEEKRAAELRAQEARYRIEMNFL